MLRCYYKKVIGWTWVRWTTYYYILVRVYITQDLAQVSGKIDLTSSPERSNPQVAFQSLCVENVVHLTDRFVFASVNL